MHGFGPRLATRRKSWGGIRVEERDGMRVGERGGRDGRDEGVTSGINGNTFYIMTYAT